MARTTRHYQAGNWSQAATATLTAYTAAVSDFPMGVLSRQLKMS